MIETMGLDQLILDFDKVSRLDEATMTRMLEAGGEVVKKAHTKAIQSLMTSRSGNLAASPYVHKKVSGGSHYVLIYPKGTHHTYRPRKGSGVASNQDVAFVHEFGGHGNAALQWMRTANEECSSDAVDAMEKQFDQFLTQHNL